MARYVYRNGAWIDPRTNEAMPIPERDGPCMPMVQSDIPEYRSPIDGRPITSRSHRRYDLESNNCVPAEPRKKPRGFINPQFAKKRGLPLAEDAAERRAKLTPKRLAFT
jgi:hypothetical protein